MINTLVKHIENIVSNKNLLSTYENLLSVFAEEVAYLNKIKVLETLFYFNNDANVYELIGDIYKYNLNNNLEAEKYYNKYLYFKNKDFYDKHQKNKKDIYDSSIPIEISKNISRLSIVASILSFFHSRHFYQEILINKENFHNLYQELINIINDYDCNLFKELNKNNAINALNNIKKELSYVLSNTESHNDINRFAIELYSKNENAYLNIIEDLFIHTNYEEALRVYNNEYIKAFPINNPIEKPAGLSWFLSDKLFFLGQIFNSVEKQKLAIELELKSMENNNG